MSREIKNIVVHCTGGDQHATPEDIQHYWRTRNKWKNDGYHLIIDMFGKLTTMQPLHLPSNGVRGHNQNSINISWIGGKYEDNRTKMQKSALANALRVLRAMYPESEIKGHRDFKGVKKSCPRFDVKEFVEDMDVNGSNF